MSEGKVFVASGVSWLQDKLMEVAQDRFDLLTEGIADGVPMQEYGPMVARRKEARRWVDFVIPEIFKDFQKADDAALEEDKLEEMPSE